MTLIIKSTQNYGTHIEEFKEEFECSVEKKENMLKINFENGLIKLEENKITYERNENKIIIEPNKTNECDYDTEHGMFVLDIKGISVENYYFNNAKDDEIKVCGTIAKAKYEIQIVGVEPYENIIEIAIK